jgi:hypothetical protein
MKFERIPNPRSRLFPRLIGRRGSYLAAETPPSCWWNHCRAGLTEPKLTAASSACGTGVTGATTGPLDGGALTVGVDALAGEGGGSSTAISTEPPWVAFLSGSSDFGSLKWYGGGAGITSRKGGACRGLGPGGAAPHRRQHTRRPRGRKAAATAVVLCRG